jgi:diadenosine tetraphosphate (Ap4A) HIT family hydrolase
MFDLKCRACLNVSGRIPLFPKGRVFEGTYWIVEHVFEPTNVFWFVIVLKRHAVALHELTNNEIREEQEILSKLIQALRKELNCELEYRINLAEGEGFKHVHTHVIPISKYLPKKFRGTHIFELKNEQNKGTIPKGTILR